MKLNKKLLLSLGTAATAALPIATVVSCGSELVKNKDGDILMSYDSSSKTVYFNLNKDKSEQIDTSSVQLKQFLPAITEKTNGGTNSITINRDKLIEINDAFQKATDPRFSNVDILKDGDVVHVVFTGQYQKESTYTLQNGEGFMERPMVKINYSMEIDYLYKNHSAITYKPITDAGGRVDSDHPDQRDKERVKARSNFLEGFITGIQEYGLLTDGSMGINEFFPKEGLLGAPSTMADQSKYINTTINPDNIKSLLVNANPFVTNAFNMPRNYETTIKLPAVDLTKALIDKPSAHGVIGQWKGMKASGNSAQGFYIDVPQGASTNYLSTKSDGNSLAEVEEYAKSLSTANTLEGFFKEQPAVSIAWENGNAYTNTTLGETHATVTLTGKDWNDKALVKSYDVTVTVY